MCLFNVPFVFMVMFWWGNLGNEDSYEGMTRLQMVALPIMIAPIIIGIVLDVISFPFHLLNLIQRRCVGAPPDPNYLYEHLFCSRGEDGGNPYVIQDDFHTTPEISVVTENE